jgi:hypothetical protein
VKVNNATNINKTNSHLSPKIIEHKKDHYNGMEIQALAWEMYKKCDGENDLLGPNPPFRLLDIHRQVGINKR